MRKSLAKMSHATSAAWLVFGFFLLLGASWAVVQPPYGVSDEPAHAIKALATANGQFSGPSVVGPFGYAAQEFQVPSAYAEIWHFVCYNSDVNTTPSCAPPFPNGDNRIALPSTAAEYPPLYYGLVGWAGWIFPGKSGLLQMRLLTVLLVAALLGWAASRLPRRNLAWTVTGLLLAMTPVVLAFTGSVNPFGPEIAAAVLFWVSCLRVANEGETDISRSDVVGLHVSAILLGLFRPASFLWIIIIVLMVSISMLAKSGSTFVDVVGKGRPICWAAVVGVLPSLTWFFFAMTGKSLGGGSPAGGSTWTNMSISFWRTDEYLQQAIGYFGWTSFKLPVILMSIGSILLVCLAIAARDGGRQLFTAGLLITLFAACGPAILEGARASVAGFGFQGRYLLPVLCGLPILLSVLTGTRELSQSLGRSFLVLAVTLQLASLFYVGKRFAVGLDGTNLWVLKSEWPGLLTELWRNVLLLGTCATGAALAMFVAQTKE